MKIPLLVRREDFGIRPGFVSDVRQSEYPNQIGELDLGDLGPSHSTYCRLYQAIGMKVRTRCLIQYEMRVAIDVRPKYPRESKAGP